MPLARQIIFLAICFAGNLVRGEPLPTPRPSATFFYALHTSIVVTRGNQAFVGNNDGLRIVDITNPFAPRQTGFYAAPGVREIFVRDQYAYISAGSSFRAVDISNPSDLRAITNDFAFSYSRLRQVGNYLFGIRFGATLGLTAFDLSNAPELARIPITTGVTLLDTKNDLLFLLNYGGTGVTVINATTFRSAGTWVRDPNVRIVAMTIQGDLAYCLLLDRLEVLDLTNPLQPSLIGSVALPAQMRVGRVELVLASRYLYIPTTLSLIVCDIANPAAPRIVANNPTLFAQRIAYDGQRLHVAADAQGYSILEPHPQIWLQPTATGVRIDGPPGISGEIQTSLDLLDWSDLLPVTLTEEPQLIADDPNGAPARFYRFLGAEP